ncbi:MAG: SDR family NAD(P)-dependent oxidoreductase [Myxococcales bacterium]|nr:SDR family NAD(P)-dependent oxidoreductase [Myxococcales bacterium]
MHVVVTGASSGIGAAIAREFGQAGARLTLLARREALLQEVAGTCGSPCRVVATDLSDPASATHWREEAEAEHGPIDVLVLNAGVEITSRVASTTLDDGQRLLAVNLLVPLAITHAVLPAMIERGSGAIVHVASVDGIVTLPGHAWYGASKAGLASFSEVLHAEVAPHGVHVMPVYPGPVATPMSDRAYEAYGGRKGLAALIPEGSPDVLARRIRVGVERRHRRVVYPGVFAPARWMPAFVRAVYDRATPWVLP